MERFEQILGPRRALERSLLELIRDYEVSTGWLITGIDYRWGDASLTTEAVPFPDPIGAASSAIQ